MMNSYSNMIDNTFEIINDMGTAPIVAAMIEVLKIPEAVNSSLGQPDPRTIVNTGVAIKALIVNVLYGRVPLVHVEESFKHLDCEVLFGKGLKSSDFNDDCLGKSLEALGNLDFHKTYSEICMNALELHDVLVKEVHVDTTNVSVYGEYDCQQAKDFEITYGDPKSKRKEFKQLNIGLYVQQNGFPIGGNALSGNTSDVIWFREALDELNGIFCGDLYTMPICIFDAAGSNENMFIKANNLSVPSIIRFSDRFNMTKEHIDKAWEDGQWDIVNKKGEILEIEPEKDVYKLRTFDTCFDGFEWRLIVVYSSELKKLKESTAKRSHPKRREVIEKMAKKLSNTGFETCEEAEQVGKIFVEKNIGETAPFKYEMTIEEKTIKKYAKRGKPTRTSDKTVNVTYHVNLVIGGRDEALYEKWLKQESCFVLVSNTPKERCNPAELFREYKEQWVVEDKFKFLKQPVVLGPIWLQKPERIKGLVFVLLLAVLVNMYVCYRCAVSLQSKSPDNSRDAMHEKRDANVIEKDMQLNKGRKPYVSMNTPVQALLNAFENNTHKQKLLSTEGRLIENPSYKVIKKILAPMKTTVKLDKFGNQHRKFAYETEGRMLDLVIKIGFNPIIYLEQFSPHMDLWRYNKY